MIAAGSMASCSSATCGLLQNLIERGSSTGIACGRALWPLSHSVRTGYGRYMKNQGLGMGAMIGIGAALSVLFMPMFGPLALVVGVALGVMLGAAFEARRTTR